MKKSWNKDKTARDDPRIAAQALAARGEGNHFFGKKHSPASIGQIRQSKLLDFEEVKSRARSSPSSPYFEVLSDQSDYAGWQQPMRVKCTTCNQETERCLMDIERGTRCHTCFPILWVRRTARTGCEVLERECPQSSQVRRG